ncbi:hypothetical protein [Mammaliicoccus sciuri]|uniref:hypothetical protein n=1 Tax=Mammaliicoccus sciuri TaxID=1296 RepID=UPI003F577B5A
MPMTQREAALIINELNNVYNMGLDDKANLEKAKIWVNTLSQSGDYEPTLKRARQYIRTSKYKPNIADVIAYKPIEIEDKEVPLEETHEWKLKHDKEYANKWHELQERGKRMLAEWSADDDEY